MIFPLAGVRFKPERVYVRSLDIVLLITLPNDNDEGLAVMVVLPGITRAVSRMSIFDENGASINDPTTLLLSRS